MQSGTERGRRRNFLFLEFLRFSFNPLYPRFLSSSYSLSLSLSLCVFLSLFFSFCFLFLGSTLRFSIYLSPYIPFALGRRTLKIFKCSREFEGTYRGLHRRNNDFMLLCHNDRWATLHIKYVDFGRYQRYYLESSEICDKHGR